MKMNVNYFRASAIVVALAFSLLLLSSCKNRFLPIPDTGLILIENKETGLRGIKFGTERGYKGAEILPVKYTDISPVIVIYGYYSVYMEFMTQEPDGTASLLKVKATMEMENNKTNIVVTPPQVVINADTIEIIRKEDEKTYYMCQGKKGKTLVCLRNQAPSFGKYYHTNIFGPYDEIFPMFDYNQCIAYKDGAASIQSLNDFLGYPLYESSHSKVVLYHMENATRKFKNGFWTYTENMGGEFYVYPTDKGTYVMSMLFSDTDDGQYLLPIYTLTAAQWADICSHDTSDEDILVKTEYFPASIIGSLYDAGRKATMWGIW